MSEYRQQRIGTDRIDGEPIEFVWAPGTRFVTAQFIGRSPRGIANVDRIDTDEPVVVPMSSHLDWLSSGDRAAALVAAGHACFAAVMNEIDSDGNRGSPRRWRTGPRPTDHNCESALPFVNERGGWARTR